MRKPRLGAKKRLSFISRLYIEKNRKMMIKLPSFHP